MSGAPVDWPLEGEPFIEHRTRVDLLGQREDDEAVRAARTAMLADPRVMDLVDELRGRPGRVISSHKSAGRPFHKLTFIADLGLRREDAGVGESVLSQFVWLHTDECYADMLGGLRAAADAHGRFTSASVRQPGKAWEFGQKKAPSRRLTLPTRSILERS